MELVFPMLRTIPYNTHASLAHATGHGDEETAYTKLAHLHKDLENAGFRAFYIMANTITINYKSILTYSINRSLNASAESFNVKIKAFRAQSRGVKNVEFFFYRLTTIFA